jgi:hypothetical protein
VVKVGGVPHRHASSIGDWMNVQHDAMRKSGSRAAASEHSLEWSLYPGQGVAGRLLEPNPENHLTKMHTTHRSGVNQER